MRVRCHGPDSVARRQRDRDAYNEMAFSSDAGEEGRQIRWGRSDEIGPRTHGFFFGHTRFFCQLFRCRGRAPDSCIRCLRREARDSLGGNDEVGPRTRGFLMVTRVFFADYSNSLRGVSVRGPASRFLGRYRGRVGLAHSCVNVRHRKERQGGVLA